MSYEIWNVRRTKWCNFFYFHRCSKFLKFRYVLSRAVNQLLPAEVRSLTSSNHGKHGKHGDLAIWLRDITTNTTDSFKYFAHTHNWEYFWDTIYVTNRCRKTNMPVLAWFNDSLLLTSKDWILVLLRRRTFWPFVRWESRLHSDIQGAQEEQDFSPLKESDQDVQLWTTRVGTDSRLCSMYKC